MDESERFLKEFFSGTVGRAFWHFRELRDEIEVQRYVAGVLANFVSIDHLCCIVGKEQRPLVQICELLVEADPVFGNAPSFERERQVRKYMGDYAMFLAGMFPASFNHFRMRWARREGDTADLIEVGKESYFVAAAFDQSPNRRKEARLFNQLGNKFELCVEGLNRAANELELLM